MSHNKKEIKYWYPQNEEEYNYLKYTYNINATFKIVPPHEKYPHDINNNDDTYIKKQNKKD